MPSIAALTLLPLLTLGQAATPPAGAPAQAPAAAATEAPAAAPAPAATPAAPTPAVSAIPEEFGLPPGYTLVFAKFKSTFYGFIEEDNIYDSTRSFVDLAGMGAIGLPQTASGDDGRYQLSIRNSRLGYRLEAPEFHGIRVSGLFEMDFVGNQPGTPPDTSTGYAESSFFNNPTFRVRHAVLKLDNDYVTLWFGQTWELMGWQGGFQPATVEIQGVPGELYSRTAQVRALHEFHFGKTATLSVAVAALRPPQFDAALPDFQGGLKLTIDKWTGVQSVGSTATGIQPAAVAFSGAVRTYKLLNNNGPDTLSTNTGWAGAADVMLPIIPAKHRKEWALTFIGEYCDGSGDADLYTGLKGGAPSAGAPAGAPATYSADIDPGLAGWSTTTNTVQTIDWQTFMLSAQLYLPPDGKLWLAGSYSNSLSDNIGQFGGPTKVFFHEIWWDANLFADVTPAVRLGFEFASFQETYGNGAQAQNLRGQLSAFYIF
ncbi:MAG TPA: hypothetical protein VMB50_21050 [Myxococcales bacterium]|nr:hypothetical protein [Myxococcales bacterium]